MDGTDGDKKALTDPEGDKGTSNEAANTPNQKEEYKPSNLKFEIRGPADLSRWEWAFIICCTLPVTAAVLAIIIFAQAKPDSPEFKVAIVLGITTAFLLVYRLHGVLMRMPYSLLVHGLCNVVLFACCIVCYFLPEDEQPMPNGDKFQIAILVLGIAATVVDIVFVVPLSIHYWRKRKMSFPYGAYAFYPDKYVKHLFATSFLLLALQLQLMLVAFILNIDKAGLANEDVKLAVGVPVSFCMCVFGFLLLLTTRKLYLVIFVGLSLTEVAYSIVYLILTRGDFPEVISGFSIAVGVANIAVSCSVPVFLMYLYKKFRTEGDDGTNKLLAGKSGE